jgi:hypothetical protein
MFPAALQQFVSLSRWTFARTMPDWPHEYIVRRNVDEALFVRLVEHIRAYGYVGRFYSRAITYFDSDGLTYWTMGALIDQTTIVNRCRKEDTFEARLAEGRLPARRSAER